VVHNGWWFTDGMGYQIEKIDDAFCLLYHLIIFSYSRLVLLNYVSSTKLRFPRGSVKYNYGSIHG
jgi:hypothetical protein